MAAREVAFSPDTAVESILYIAARLGGNPTFHEVLKLRYFADTLHLSKFGWMVSGDAYKAMKFGPVGSNTYNLLKAARGDESEWIHPHFIEVVAGVLNVPDGKSVVALRQPDTSKLSRSEMQCLDEAIEKYGHMSFSERTALSHDSAWQEAFDAKDESLAGRMRVESIAKTLPNADEVLEHLHS